MIEARSYSDGRTGHDTWALYDTAFSLLSYFTGGLCAKAASRARLYLAIKCVTRTEQRGPRCTSSYRMAPDPRVTFSSKYSSNLVRRRGFVM